jgi:hypothetical protein
VFDDALGQRPFPVRADESMRAAFAAGRAGSNVENVVGVDVGDLNRPVTVEDVRRGENDRLVGKFEQRAAVNRVVVGRIGQDVVGGGERLHVADLVWRRGGRDLLRLFEHRRIEADLALAFEDEQRETEDVVLHANGIGPFALGLGVGAPDFVAGGLSESRRMSGDRRERGRCEYG